MLTVCPWKMLTFIYVYSWSFCLFSVKRLYFLWPFLLWVVLFQDLPLVLRAATATVAIRFDMHLPFSILKLNCWNTYIEATKTCHGHPKWQYVNAQCDESNIGGAPSALALYPICIGSCARDPSPTAFAIKGYFHYGSINALFFLRRERIEGVWP